MNTNAVQMIPFCLVIWVVSIPFVTTEIIVDLTEPLDKAASPKKVIVQSDRGCVTT